MAESHEQGRDGQTPAGGGPVEYRSPGTESPPATGKQVYNVVADTVMGPNVRLKDNLMQLAACAAGAVLGAIIGPLFTREPIAGVLIGGLIGLIAGLLISGIYLMIYRGVRHAKGKHD